MNLWTETGFLPVLILAGVVSLLVILTMILLVRSRKLRPENNPLTSSTDRVFVFLILVAMFMLGAFVMSLFFV